MVASLAEVARGDARGVARDRRVAADPRVTATRASDLPGGLTPTTTAACAPETGDARSGDRARRSRRSRRGGAGSCAAEGAPGVAIAPAPRDALRAAAPARPRPTLSRALRRPPRRRTPTGGGPHRARRDAKAPRAARRVPRRARRTHPRRDPRAMAPRGAPARAATTTTTREKRGKTRDAPPPPARRQTTPPRPAL